MGLAAASKRCSSPVLNRAFPRLASCWHRWRRQGTLLLGDIALRGHQGQALPKVTDRTGVFPSVSLPLVPWPPQPPHPRPREKGEPRPREQARGEEMEEGRRKEGQSGAEKGETQQAEIADERK